jgi:lipoate-protein ligase A
MLWRNGSSVIIGRNQNAAEEMDMDFIREHEIAVIRRQSGGGAVFHDLGNLNFTVIHALGEDDFSNYARFTAPIVEFLRELGVDARLEGRNDLVIDGMKFSGNAQAVKNGRIMHHGTILYRADVSRLAGALRPRPIKIESKGVKSVRSRITNVADHLLEVMPVEEFFERLAAFFLARTDGEYRLTEADIAAVDQLVAEKYGTWEWNIGSSPAYNYEKSERFPSGIVDLRLTVEEGVIKEANIFGDFFGVRDKAALEERLTGVRHERQAIAAAVADIDLGQFIHGVGMEEFLGMF